MFSFVAAFSFFFFHALCLTSPSSLWGPCRNKNRLDMKLSFSVSSFVFFLIWGKLMSFPVTHHPYPAHAAFASMFCRSSFLGLLSAEFHFLCETRSVRCEWSFLTYPSTRVSSLALDLFLFFSFFAVDAVLTCMPTGKLCVKCYFHSFSVS